MLVSNWPCFSLNNTGSVMVQYKVETWPVSATHDITWLVSWYHMALSHYYTVMFMQGGIVFNVLTFENYETSIFNLNLQNAENGWPTASFFLYFSYYYEIGGVLFQCWPANQCFGWNFMSSQLTKSTIDTTQVNRNNVIELYLKCMCIHIFFNPWCKEFFVS